MNDLVQRLRANSADPLAQEAATHIEGLDASLARARALLDKASSILFAGIMDEKGIDTDAADVCIDAIRGDLALAGKVATEHHLQMLLDRLAAAAGLAPGTGFDPLHLLDQMHTSINVQSGNAPKLEWALGLIWRPGTPATPPRLLVAFDGERPVYREFAAGTSWVEALHAAMAA